jgi:hypothetical protein
MTLPFEVDGNLPGWEEEMASFVEAVTSHPWGGLGPDRVVTAPIREGSFVDSIERYMPPDEFARWVATLGPQPRIAAKTFLATDGKVTTVLLELPFREMFLYGFTHQVLEATGLHREQAEGYVWPEDATINAHVLWRHYVVDRARREVSDDIGLSLGDFDDTELVSEARDVEDALTEAARSGRERPGPEDGDRG